MEATIIFFWQPAAGLTNQVPVQDSRAGTPLANIRVFRCFFFDSRRLWTLQCGYASGRVGFKKLRRRCINLDAIVVVETEKVAWR